MRGLKSTIALIVVLAGLGAYIYFVSWRQADKTDTAKQDKVFVALEPDKIEEVKVKSEKGDTTTIKKENGAWQMTAPVATKADESEVTGITTSLGQIAVVRVIDENPSDLKEYGLATPRIEINFKASGDKDYRKLYIGEKSPTGADLFAKRNDEKKVFLIPAFQESSFNKGTFDLRDKTLWKFERDKVDSLDVTAGGKTIAMTRATGDWKITKPVESRADFGAVEGLIGRLQSAQMKSIVADQATPADLKKYGLEKPEVTVNVSTGSAKATLLVGGKAEDNTVYVRDLSRPAVMTVESSLVDELKKGADDYRKKDIFEFRAFNANRVEITRNGQSVAFEKTKGQGENAPDKWKRVSPTPGDVDKDKIDSLLSRLSNMRATSFVAADAKTGLDKPAMTVVAKFDDGKKEDRVTFGKNG
ncbi:MAG: hypothetical protein AUH72_10200, partial [Acidobacteria bacterium 13_1_40CM_4_65_8]